MEYKYSNITEKIIKAAMTVHSILGNACLPARQGFQEIVYQRALAIEFDLMNILYRREFAMQIYYKEKHIAERRVDFLVEEKISVEIKALIKLDNINLAQGMNYLEAYNLEIGMLINFWSAQFRMEKII